jgi:hypothetical protein
LAFFFATLWEYGRLQRIAHQNEIEKDDSGRQKEETAEGKEERIVSHG